jgi:methyl-accepting chemotaxis protein
MGANSGQTAAEVDLVTAASVEVERHIQTVSAGAEEMSASISEIIAIIDQIAEFQATIAAAVEQQAAVLAEVTDQLSKATVAADQVLAGLDTLIDRSDSRSSG